MTGLLGLDYSRVPDQWAGGLRRYFECGIEPGSGLRAVLENDLLEAIGRIYDGIDYTKLGVDLVSLCSFLYNEAPARPNAIWGSREAVTIWLARDWTEARAAYRDETP